MSELLRELEEDIRNERMQRLWNSFGKMIVRFSIAIILATVAVVVWQDWKQSRAEEQTAQFIKGIDRMAVEDYKGAIEALEAIGDDRSSPYRALAMLQKARAQSALGDREGARATYRALAAYPSSGGNEAFVALASLLAAQDMDEPVDVDPDSPFTHSQREQAAWQLLAAGKEEEAIQTFIALRDNSDAPRSLRTRAGVVLAYLSPKAKTDD